MQILRNYFTTFVYPSQDFWPFSSLGHSLFSLFTVLFPFGISLPSWPFSPLLAFLFPLGRSLLFWHFSSLLAVLFFSIFTAQFAHCTCFKAVPMPHLPTARSLFPHSWRYFSPLLLPPASLFTHPGGTSPLSCYRQLRLSLTPAVFLPPLATARPAFRSPRRYFLPLLLPPATPFAHPGGTSPLSCYRQLRFSRVPAVLLPFLATARLAFRAPRRYFSPPLLPPATPIAHPGGTSHLPCYRQLRFSRIPAVLLTSLATARFAFRSPRRYFSPLLLPPASPFALPGGNSPLTCYRPPRFSLAPAVLPPFRATARFAFRLPRR